MVLIEKDYVFLKDIYCVLNVKDFNHVMKSFSVCANLFC